MSSKSTNHEQAREFRLAKSLSQYDAAQLMGRSQAYISLLEQGRRSEEDVQRYLQTLANWDGTAQFLATGKSEVETIRPIGVAQRRVTRTVETHLRDQRLMPGFNHESTLPKGHHWKILRICQTAQDTELAFLYETQTDAFGLVAFYLIDGTIRRGRIIPIERRNFASVGAALEAFAIKNLGLQLHTADNVLEKADDDDGLLADSEVASSK